MDLSQNGAAAPPQPAAENPAQPPTPTEPPAYFNGQHGQPAPPSPIPSSNGVPSFQLPTPLQQMHSTPFNSPTNQRAYNFGPHLVAGSIPISHYPPWRRAHAMQDQNQRDADHSRDSAQTADTAAAHWDADSGPSAGNDLWPPHPRERFTYTRFQLAILNAVYERIRYPTATQKWIISKRMMITKDQVKAMLFDNLHIWFQNRRRKDVVDKKTEQNGQPAGKSSEDRNTRDGPSKHIIDQIIQELLDNQDIVHPNGNARKPTSRALGYRRVDNGTSHAEISPSAAAAEHSAESIPEADLPMPSLQRPPSGLEEMIRSLSPLSDACPPTQSPDSGKPESPGESGDSAGSPAAAVVPAQPASIPTNEVLDMVAPPNVSVPGSACVPEMVFNTPPSSPEIQPPQLQPPQSTSPPPPNTVSTDAPENDVTAPNPPPRMSTGFWDAVESGEILNRYPNLMEQHLNNPYFYHHPHSIGPPPFLPPYHPRFIADQAYSYSMQEHQSQIRSYPNPFFNHDSSGHQGGLWPYSYQGSNSAPSPHLDPWRLQDSFWGRESQQSEEDDMNPSR